MLRRFPKTAAIAASAVAVGAVAAGVVAANSGSSTPSSQSAALASSVTTKAYGTPIAGRHSLLISVDGLHASDLANYIAMYPNSNLAKLSRKGTTYTHALTTFPSDSFPGMLALATGGTSKQTGVYYDVSYNRALYAPGSNCDPKSLGTVVAYDESADYSTKYLSGTTPPPPPPGFNSTALNPANLPLMKSGANCTPVYPKNYLLTNTIFEVAHNAGLYTAWSDKHPAYQILEGPDSLNPSGTETINDLYTPEINSTASPTNSLTVPFGPDKGTAINGGGDFTQSVNAAMAYDNTKVNAIVNQINGMTSTGGTPAGGKKVPSIFGMNFQAVSVGQKVPVGGYYDHGQTFSPQLLLALNFVDNSLGQMVTQLQNNGLMKSTQIIITAKHGQSPINRSLLHRIAEDVPGDQSSITGFMNANSAGHNLAAETSDDVSLDWWQNPADSAGIAAAANADINGKNLLSIDHVISGAELSQMFGTPSTTTNYLDQGSRVPDVILQPNKGVIYSLSQKKVAEHGGGTMDDRNVALLVVGGSGWYSASRRADSGHGWDGGKTIRMQVETTQVAPTILKWLGLKPSSLTAVQQAGTPVLPTKH